MDAPKETLEQLTEFLNREIKTSQDKNTAFLELYIDRVQINTISLPHNLMDVTVFIKPEYNIYTSSQGYAIGSSRPQAHHSNIVFNFEDRVRYVVNNTVGKYLSIRNLEMRLEIEKRNPPKHKTQDLQSFKRILKKFYKTKYKLTRFFAS